MQFFIADETNTTPDGRPFDFFVYGGLTVTDSTLASLSRKMLNLKMAHAIPYERPLKWSNQKWSNGGVVANSLDASLHKELKRQVLEMVAASDCSIIVIFSPHYFYKGFFGLRVNSAKFIRTHKYAMTDCLGKFDRFLSEKDQRGIVMYDEFPPGICDQMEPHCFSCYTGGSYPFLAAPPIAMDDSKSQIHQINDIVIGSIAASLQEAAFNALPQLKDRFWAHPTSGAVIGRGISIYPQRPDTVALADKLARLENKVNRLLTKQGV